MKLKLLSQKPSNLKWMIAQAFCWSLKLALLKLALLFAPLSYLALGVVSVEGGVYFFLRPKSKTKQQAPVSLRPFDLLFSFVLLAGVYALLTAIKHLPLSTTLSILFSYPLFTPLILRYWIGKKIIPRHKYYLLGFPAILLLFLRYNNPLEYMALILLITASALKAYEYVSRKRFYPSSDSFSPLKEPYILSFFLGLPLIFVEHPPSSPLFFTLSLLGYGVLKVIEKRPLKMKLKRPLFFESYPIIFATSLLICALLDFFYFKCNYIYYYLSACCANSLYLLGIFLQKKILPNPSYDL